MPVISAFQPGVHMLSAATGEIVSRRYYNSFTVDQRSNTNSLVADGMYHTSSC